MANEGHLTVSYQVQRCGYRTSLADNLHLLQETDSLRLLLRSTRLGSKIVLSKDLNQMLVALGEAYPWKTL